MLNKKEFINIINHLKEVKDFIDETNDRVRKLNDSLMGDFFDANGLIIMFEDDLIKVLENMFNTDLISWWIYETNYGKDFKIGNLVEQNGDKPDISTVDKLYDYLVSNIQSS